MSQEKDVKLQDDDACAEDAQQPKTALKADYRGATPREVAAALLAYRPKPQRSVKPKKTK